MAASKRRYLSVDPGPTTGFCQIDESSTAPRLTITSLNFELNLKHPHRSLYEHLTLRNPEIVICERFQFRPNQKGVDIRAGEYFGVVQLWCQDNAVPIVIQNSSVVGRTAFWSDTNNRVKQLRLYSSKAAPHGMDALRHFLYYYTFTLKGRYFLEKLVHDD
jgi:hypothetical protein